MYTSTRRVIFAAFVLFFWLGSPGLWAQSAGNSGTVVGTVTDSTGAIVADASVTIVNPVSGYSRVTTSDSSGHYQFTNLPLNPYHVIVSVKGFSTATQDVEVRSFVPITLKTALTIGAASTVVNVTGSDLVESDSTFHTDVDRGLFNKLPLESQSSSLSSQNQTVTPANAPKSEQSRSMPAFTLHHPIRRPRLSR
jgi:hypothetical protein